jgi:hypothetical protein
VPASLGEVVDQLFARLDGCDPLVIATRGVDPGGLEGDHLRLERSDDVRL